MSSQIFALPHSNAAEERVYSIVTKNKTAFRPNLSLDGKLSSILITLKLANPEPCFDYKPQDTILNEAKKKKNSQQQSLIMCA